MAKKKTCLAIFLLLTTPFSSHIHSYDVPLPEDEASPTLFSVTPEEDDTDLYLEGTWNFSLTGGIGFGYSPDRGFFSGAAPEGITAGFGWEQTPDLTLSLWLFDRYFLETSFSQEWEDSTFLLGMVGGEEDWVNRVHIGNTAIDMGSYAGITVSEAPPNGLGVTGRFTPPRSVHEVLLRFDPTERRDLVFIGSNRVEESWIDPAAFIRSRFFFLPGSTFANFRVFQESADSGALSGDDGRAYLPADPADYRFDAARGLLTFVEPQTARVLVSYTGAPSAFSFSDAGPAWDPGNSQALKTVTLSDGTETRLLWSPGEFSPWEVNRYYAAETSPRADDLGGARLTLTPRADPEGTGIPLPWSLADPEILSVGEGSGAPGTLKFHYPLHDTDSGALLYGPAASLDPHEPAPEDPDYFPHIKNDVPEVLRLQILENSDSYGLDNPLPGSVKLKINGVTENRFTLDGSRLTINRPVYPNDRVEISYHTGGTGGGGDLLWGWGSRFFPWSGLTLEAGAGLRWNLFGGTYTNRENQSPGALEGSLQGRYESDYLKAELTGLISLNNPDTTGSFRLLGMEEEGFALPLSLYNVYPAAPGDLYPANQRGILYGRDYHLYTLLGSAVLQDYQAVIPEDQIFPYAEGNPAGPYLAAAGSDGRGGQVAVLEAEWKEPGEWVGVQIPLRPPNGTGRDLSSVRTLNLPWRWAGDIPGDIDVVVELGTLGEDLDGDGRIDQEAGDFSAGFSFFDANQGITLTYGGGGLGGGNGFLDSEDTNGNGVLDGENPFQLLKITISPSYPGYPSGTWDFLRIPLTDEDRKKLTSVTAVRIRAVHNGASEGREGKLLVGDLFFEGSPMTPGGDTAAMEVSEIYEGHLPSSDLPAKPLESLFPQVSEKFHPAGEHQKILRHHWDNPAGATWSLTGYIPPVSLSSYSALSFYLRVAELTDAPGNLLTVALGGPGGAGFTASFPAAAVTPGEWGIITVDYRAGEIRVDGQTVPGGTLTFPTSSAPATTLTFSMSDTTAGTIYIDEVHLHDPVLSGSLGGRGMMEYRRPGALVTWGETKLLADPALRLEGSAAGEKWGTDGGNPGVSRFDGRAEGGITVMGARIDTAWDFHSVSGDEGWGGGHSLNLPLAFWDLTLTDRFSLTGGSGEESFSRGNSLSLQPHAVTSLQLTAEAVYDGSEEELSQTWEGDWALGSPEKFSLSLGSRWTQLTAGELADLENYPRTWREGYRFLMPREDGAPRQRKIDLQGNLSAVWGRTAPELQLKAGYFNILDREDPEQTFEALTELKVPLRLGSGPAVWLLTPSYGRYFKMRSGESGADFPEDLTLTGFQMNQIFPLLIKGPGLELFSPSVWDDFIVIEDDPLLLSVSYRPSWGLALSRPAGSWLSNLYLPTGLEFRQERSLNGKDGTVEDLLSSALTLRYGFLNLFGKLGAYPRFRFYETEEVVNLFSWRWVEDLESRRREELQFSLQNYSFLRLSSRNSLEFAGTGTLVRGDKESLLIEGDLTWVRRRPLPRLSLPSFLSPEALKGGELHHSEGFSGSGRRDENESKTSLTLSHETAVVLSTGRIGIFISASAELNPSPEPYYLFGIEAGITGKFSF